MLIKNHTEVSLKHNLHHDSYNNLIYKAPKALASEVLAAGQSPLRQQQKHCSPKKSSPSQGVKCHLKKGLYLED